MISLWIGLSSKWQSDNLSVTFLVSPSLLGIGFSTRASFLGEESSMSTTMSSGRGSRTLWLHFCLFWRLWRYSSFQRAQNCSARYCTRLQRFRLHKSCSSKSPGGADGLSAYMVRSIFGFSGRGSTDVSRTNCCAVSGRLFTMAIHSSVRCSIGDVWMFNNHTT